MRSLSFCSMVSMLLLATLSGGAVFQLLVAAEDLPTALTFALLALLLAGAISLGTRHDRSGVNPYW